MPALGALTRFVSAQFWILPGEKQMTQNMLSQEEIDALFLGDDAPDVTIDKTSTGSNVRPYDATTQHRVVKERLHALDVINERFAREFRSDLFQLLRRTADITVDSIQYQSYKTFSQYMPTPMNFNLVAMKPLRGNALMVFPSNLVYGVVDNLFGGDGKLIMKSEGRDFTPTEHRIIGLLLEKAIRCYEHAWNGVYQIKISLIRSEMQPQFANPTSSSNEVVVNSTFNLEVGDLRTKFNIAIPYLMIEPLRALLNGPLETNREEERHWQEQMAIELQETEVEIEAPLVDIKMTLKNLTELKVGDFIQVDFPEIVTANVQGIPIMKCEFGTLSDQRALVVQSLVDHREGLKASLRDLIPLQ